VSFDIAAAGAGDEHPYEVTAGDTLTTRIWHLGGAYGCEAVSGQDATVVKDGCAELRT
jgi:hypothetical protein